MNLLKTVLMKKNRWFAGFLLTPISTVIYYDAIISTITQIYTDMTSCRCKKMILKYNKILQLTSTPQKYVKGFCATIHFLFCKGRNIGKLDQNHESSMQGSNLCQLIQSLITHLCKWLLLYWWNRINITKGEMY